MKITLCLFVSRAPVPAKKTIEVQLKGRSLQELLLEDQTKIKRQGSCNFWYHPNLNREEAERLLQSGESEV